MLLVKQFNHSPTILAPCHIFNGNVHKDSKLFGNNEFRNNYGHNMNNMDTYKFNYFKILMVTGLLTCIIALPVSSMAQNYGTKNPFMPDSSNSNNQSMQNDNKSAKGKWALMFQIDKNFTLKDFSGSIISVQRNLSNDNAIRLGLNLSGGYNVQRNNPTEKKTTGTFHIGISTDYLWYIYANQEVRFYYGIGPDLAFGYNHVKNSQNSGVIVSKQINKTEKLGINGVAGVEWFVRPQISLLAEYVPALTSNYKSTINRTSNTNSGISTRTKTRTNGIHFGPNPVRFGIAVYF